MDDPREIFGDVIHCYTRREAIQDGALIDTTTTAREAGFTLPVAITASLWADINDIPPSKQGLQDADGRLWDLLFMAAMACKRGRQNCRGELLFNLVMHVGRHTYYTAKLALGPGDDLEPVVTIMKPAED